ncbi:hypothetical protein D2T29_08245 [Sinirhodobacter populi]|uniref:Sulfotransferase family protein n=1 Tax=Paenirhodobacter populi TaxID=2306993 RepID=A0A443KJT8_9RHOB|nr:hypothetical protein [Sinirhodobacter populi]RWR33029.1 hypothetical protein D2T29_08245 [Sinirhodobacter populi]
MRVLLHPGFHKTATTTAQDFLHENRKLIWPHAALVLPARIRPVTEAVFAGTGITAAMTAFLRGLDLTPRRTILISGENLLGRMPRGLTGAPYPDAVPNLRALLAAFAGLGWPCEVTLYLSTRDQAGWEESLWAHHARKDRDEPFTDDLASFRARVGQVSLAEQLDRIRAGLPGLRILSHDIAEFAAMPLGPGQPFVDFLALPEAQLRAFRPVAARNASLPREMTERFLALNRDWNTDTPAAKRALRQAEGDAR